MSLPTPPGTSHRDKENRTPRTSSGSRVVWSQNNKYHNATSPPRQRLPTSASKVAPAKSILKAPHYPFLPMIIEKQRESTPEPGDPLADLNYLDRPVSKIVASDTSLRELIESYSVLAARLKSAVDEQTDADSSWPLFQPLRTHRAQFVDAVVRDLGKAMVDPLAGVALSEQTDRDCPVEEPRPLLPSPRKSPKKKRGMSEEQVKHARDLCTTAHAVIKLVGIVFTLPAIYQIFSDKELGLILTHVLAIPLAQELPTPNARKTCALSIWLLQAQRLPAKVLEPARDRIAYAIRRAIEGELGKEGKKGSVSDGLKAIHDLSLHNPAIFVPALTELMPTVLRHLLAATLPLRVQACHALGGFTLALSRIPISQYHTALSDTIEYFLVTPPQASPRKPSAGEAMAPLDPLIVRTIRTTLSAEEANNTAQGPVWALSVLASFIVLLGPRLCLSTKLARIVSALLSLAMRHRKSSVRALTCLIWRPLIWVYFRPPLIEADENGDPVVEQLDAEHVTLAPEDAVKREPFWRVIRSVVDMGAGIAAIGALLTIYVDDDKTMEKVMYILKMMVQRGGYACHDAMEIVKRFVGTEAAPEWQWDKLLPQALFSSYPGLLTVELSSLSLVVKPIFDSTPIPEDVRPLTRTELASEGVFDGLVAIWRQGLTHVHLAANAELPSEILDTWKGLLEVSVSGFQESRDENGMSVMTKRTATILTEILGDQTIQLSAAAETADDSILEAPEDAPSPPLHNRSNAAMKLCVIRDLWDIVCKALPDDYRGVAGETLGSYLVEKEADLTWETDSPDDARSEWTWLCSEVLVHCPVGLLKTFWGVDGTTRQWDWQWTVEVRSLVWRTFIERWHEIAPSKWENTLFLLAVPFGDKDSWEMSDDDLNVWESILGSCMKKALDEGVESVRVIEYISGLISSTHIPTSTSSTRVVDVLLSHLDVTEISEVPCALLELVNDTLQSTYPPEPRNKMMSLWLIRTVTRLVETCPVKLLYRTLCALQDGAIIWIADAYEVFYDEEYSFDIVPLYQTMVICLRSLLASTESLVVLSPLLASGFRRSSDIPPAILQIFTEFWEATCAKISPPKGGWPKELLAHIPVPSTKTGFAGALALTKHTASETVPSEANIFSHNAAGQAVLGSVFKLGYTPDPAPVETTAAKTSIEVMPRTPPSRSISLPKTPQAGSSTPSSPHRPLESAVSSTRHEDPYDSPLTPLDSVFLHAAATPATPKSPSRSPTKDKSIADKENMSPHSPTASVVERIHMRSPPTSVLGKRSLDSPYWERPVKRGKSSPGALLAAIQEDGFAAAAVFSLRPQSPSSESTCSNDSEDERLTVEQALLSSPDSVDESTSPLLCNIDDKKTTPLRLHRRSLATKGHKRMIMEAVEVPFLRDIRRRERTKSVQTARATPRRSLRRIQSLPEAKTPMQRKVLPRKGRKDLLSRSNSSPISPSLSSPLRALEDAQGLGSDDSMVFTDPSHRYRVDLPSSDDDPHIGQVTPHHLVSPAMRRLHDSLASDPPSDDSNVSVSPSREHMARKMQRTGVKMDLRPSPLRLHMQKHPSISRPSTPIRR